MKTLGVFAILLCITVGSQARVFGKCDLARELLRFEWAFSRQNLANWVCLVMAESSGNTAAVGGPNTDGSYDYGLFQINSRYWCTVGSPGNGCNIDCNALLSDDGVGVAASCVKLIWDGSGFSAWMGWLRACQNQPLPDLGDCGIYAYNATENAIN